MSLEPTVENHARLHSEIQTIEQSSHTPIYNTRSVVLQTGVPAPTLRAWERRYQLLSPERADNAYRLYSQHDIHLILWLKERVESGISISQAIALFRHLNTLSPSEDPFRERSTASPFRVALTGTSPEAPSVELQQETTPDRPATPEEHGNNTQQVVQDHLIEIFQHLDEQTAHVLMGSMFSLYPVEEVCQEIITPTLWKVGRLWSEGRLSTSVEHFASNFFRALLTNRFYVTPGPLHGPLVIVGSAPQEAHEIASLMLALFLRRQRLRVAYLGQSIETTGLLHTVRHLQPALLCLSITMPEHLPGLLTLGQQLRELPTPHPTLVFGGQAFAHNAQAAAEIPGLYLQGELTTITEKLQSLVLT